jgi:hypothetical protein
MADDGSFKARTTQQMQRSLPSQEIAPSPTSFTDLQLYANETPPSDRILNLIQYLRDREAGIFHSDNPWLSFALPLHEYLELLHILKRDNETLSGFLEHKIR